MKYRYKRKNYSDVFQLAKEMYKEPEFFAKELKGKNLLDFISSQDKNKASEIIKISKMIIPDDILVFKATYILNPYISFRFSKKVFNTYQELGLAMLLSSPQMNSSLSQIVTFSLISEHMVSTNFSVENPEVYEKICEYQKEGMSDLSYGYFLIAYYLSKKNNIIFDNVEYPDLFSFVYYLNHSSYDKEELGRLLSHSAMLKAYSKFGKEKNKVDSFLHINSELDKSEQLLKEFIKEHKL